MAITERLRHWYVDSKIRYERGFQYINVLKQPLMALTMMKIFNMPMWLMIMFVPVWFVVLYSLGWLDQFVFKVWQVESEWGQRNINPFYQEVLKRIKKIEEKDENIIIAVNIIYIDEDAKDSMIKVIFQKQRKDIRTNKIKQEEINAV